MNFAKPVGAGPPKKEDEKKETKMKPEGGLFGGLNLSEDKKEDIKKEDGGLFNGLGGLGKGLFSNDKVKDDKVSCEKEESGEANKTGKEIDLKNESV